MIDARSLWTAVLSTAHRARYFARLWFLSDNHQPCSFKWICDHLDLDAGWLRRRLFEMVDGSPNGVDRIPIQLVALLAEEYDEEESGPQPSATVYTRPTS